MEGIFSLKWYSFSRKNIHIYSHNIHMIQSEFFQCASPAWFPKLIRTEPTAFNENPSQLDSIFYRLQEISSDFVVCFCFLLMRWSEFSRHHLLCSLVPIRSRTLHFSLLQSQSWFTRLEMAVISTKVVIWEGEAYWNQHHVCLSPAINYNHPCNVKPRMDAHLHVEAHCSYCSLY
jgi:hypothetical protein